MKPPQSKPIDELRMSGREFDKIMRGALQVQPPETAKKKRAAKAKSVRKKAA